jgi:hypothetical protein
MGNITAAMSETKDRKMEYIEESDGSLSYVVYIKLNKLRERISRETLMR